MQNFVFDLYGTLADISTDESSEKFKTKVGRYFAHLNPNVNDFFALYYDYCARRSGGGYCESELFGVFLDILAYGGNCTDEKTERRAARYFRKKSRSRLKLYGGVRALLKNLKRRGAKLYILSNAQACFTWDEIKKLKIAKYFDGIELSSDFGEKKPSPAFFKHIADKYSLDTNSVVYTGNDFAADIAGAKAAGFKAVYIKSNLSPETDDMREVKAVADFATDNFKSLAAYLLGLCGN